MKIKPLITALSFILTTSVILPAYADINIEFKSGEQHKITDEHYKTIQDEGVSILNFKEKTIKFLSEHDKSYVQMSHQDACNIGNVIQEKVEDTASNVLKGFPEEQRAMIADIIAKEQSANVKSMNNIEIINLGASDAIAGYKTTKYKVVVRGEVKEVLWQTTDKAVINELKPTLAFAEELLCEDENDYQESKLYRALSKKGYALKIYLNSAAEDESNNSFGDNDYDDEDIKEVVSINFTNISNAEFNVPADYKKTTMEEQMKKMFTRLQVTAGE